MTLVKKNMQKHRNVAFGDALSLEDAPLTSRSSLELRSPQCIITLNFSKIRQPAAA